MAHGVRLWWVKYWTGQKVHSDFSTTSYWKTQTNFLANPILCKTYRGIGILNFQNRGKTLYVGEKFSVNLKESRKGEEKGMQISWNKN